MKTRILFTIACMLLTIGFNSNLVFAGEKTTSSEKSTLRVVTTPDLFSLTQKWAAAYNTLHPDYLINVVQKEGSSIPASTADNEVAILSQESISSLPQPPAWSAVVARDVIVPVMSAKNPYLADINRQGVTREALSKIIANPEQQSWAKLLDNAQNKPVHCYVLNNKDVVACLSSFLKVDLAALPGIKMVSAAEIVTALGNDPEALGFCRLIDVTNVGGQSIYGNLSLVPIDKNMNGKIDFMEDIYGNLQDFTRGVWIGKYPKALSGSIYAVAPAQPADETGAQFLRWVLTDGQQYLNSMGYSDLVYNERQTQLDKLNNPAVIVAPVSNDSYALLKTIVMVALLLTLVGFALSVIFLRFKTDRTIRTERPSGTPASFDENTVVLPKGLYFDKTHTWAFMEKDGIVKIGIDDFLQHVTGPVTGIGMKPAGVKIKKGDPLLTIIQRGKHLTLYAPVSGTILSNNTSLLKNASAVNAAPYTDGWVYTIEATNWLREIQFLTMAEKYKTWLRDEFTRLKDFLAHAVNIESPGYAMATLQDGGSLNDHLLADLGPEVWEDFQTKFIDTVR